MPTNRAIPRIYLDACVWIDAIQQTASQWPYLKPLVDKARNGDLKIVASQLIRVEVLRIGPAAQVLSPDDREAIRSALIADYVELRNVDSRIGDRAAEIRRVYSTRLADSIHVATAMETLCPVLLTRDGTQGDARKMLALDGRLGAPPLRIMTPIDYQNHVFATSAPLWAPPSK